MAKLNLMDKLLHLLARKPIFRVPKVPAIKGSVFITIPSDKHLCAH